MKSYWNCSHGIIFVEYDASGSKIEYNGTRYNGAMLEYTIKIGELKQAEEKEINQIHLNLQEARSGHNVSAYAEEVVIRVKYAKLRGAIRKPDRRDYPLDLECKSTSGRRFYPF